MPPPRNANQIEATLYLPAIALNKACKYFPLYVGHSIIVSSNSVEHLVSGLF